MSMPAHSSHKNTRGMSLVELLVALTLGLLLTAGVIQLFVGSKMTYQSSEARARVQESGRFAMELLKPELRQAGTNAFCAANLNVRNHLSSDASLDAFYDPDRAVLGWEYTGTDIGDEHTIGDLDPDGANPGDWTLVNNDGSTLTLPDKLQDLVVPGSDVLLVRKMVIVPNLTGDDGATNNPNQNAIVTNQDTGIAACEIVMVSNCTTGADIFQNVNAANAGALARGNGCSDPGNENQNFSASYDETMQVFRVVTTAYYIGYDTDREEPGLYTMDLTVGADSATPQELVEGVESLQVFYGFSNPAFSGGDGQSVDQWVTADAVDDWGLVIALRLGVVARSPENVDTTELGQTFNLYGVDVTNPADRKLREPFTSTVALRNRLIIQ